MKRLFSISLVTLILLSIGFSACSKSSSAATTSFPGATYVVASDATWPPFESVNEQTKQLEGFDIDLIHAIATDQQFNINVKNITWTALLAGMANGTYDAAISSISITPDRQKQMLFSDPFLAAGQVVVVQTSNTTIKSNADLTGKKVGAQVDTTGAMEIDKIAGATNKSYDTIGLAFQDLINGQIDAVVADAPMANFYVNKNPSKLKVVGSIFTSEQYGIAVSNTQPALLTKINAGLKDLKANGTFNTLLTKWGINS